MLLWYIVPFDGWMSKVKMNLFWPVWDICKLGTSRLSVEAQPQVSVSPKPLFTPGDSWTKDRRKGDGWSEQGWEKGGMR